MDQQTTFATLDYIETDEHGNQIGVLVFDDGQQLTIPLERLPFGSREGSVLSLTLELDEPESQRRLDEIRELQQRLFGLHFPDKPEST